MRRGDREIGLLCSNLGFSQHACLIVATTLIFLKKFPSLSYSFCKNSNKSFNQCSCSKRENGKKKEEEKKLKIKVAVARQALQTPFGSTSHAHASVTTYFFLTKTYMLQMN